MSKFNVLFHSPTSLIGSHDSGDLIRPSLMYKAFLELDCNVYLCTGNLIERRFEFEKLKNEGVVIDLIYSELASRPIYLTDKKNILKSFFMDFYYFYYFKNKGARVGVYYRDMHWAYSGVSRPTGTIKNIINKFFHLYELFSLRFLVNIFFVPSVKMLDKIPAFFFPTNKKALPPGCIVRASCNKINNEKSTLRCFYVGGCTPPLYDLVYIFKAAKKMLDVEFYLSLRELDWLSVKHIYGDLSDNIKILHLEGEELLDFIERCDVQLVVYPETEYRNIALPVKIFESVSCNVPVIVFDHGLTADLVRKEGIGWVVKDFDMLIDVLDNIKNRRFVLDDKKNSCYGFMVNNTWKIRAKFVVDSLLNHDD